EKVGLPLAFGCATRLPRGPSFTAGQVARGCPGGSVCDFHRRVLHRGDKGFLVGGLTSHIAGCKSADGESDQLRGSSEPCLGLIAPARLALSEPLRNFQRPTALGMRRQVAPAAGTGP